MRAALLLALCLLATDLSAQSQITTIDAQAELNRLLSTKGKFRKERLVEQTVRECEYKPCLMGDHECLRCQNVKKHVQQVYTDHLRVSAVTGFVKGDVFVDPKFAILPDELHLHPMDIVNCSPDEKQSLTKTLGGTHQATTSLQVTRSVTNTTTITGNVQFKFLDVGSAQLTLSGSRAVTFTTTESQTASETLNRTETVTLVAPPRTRSKAVLRVIEGGAIAPFRATIVLDGPVDANLDGKQMASQVLSEAERTIQVEGILRVSSASQTQVIRTDAPVTAEYCPLKDERIHITEWERISVPADAIATELDMSSLTEKKLQIVRPAKHFASLFGTASTDSTKKHESRLVGQPFDDLMSSGIPGNVCYIGPCNLPPDGHRLVCRYDESGACFDCFDARDPVCDAPPDPKTAKPALDKKPSK
jgi:hypothetical protein